MYIAKERFYDRKLKAIFYKGAVYPGDAGTPSVDWLRRLLTANNNAGRAVLEEAPEQPMEADGTPATDTPTTPPEQPLEGVGTPLEADDVPVADATIKSTRRRR